MRKWLVIVGGALALGAVMSLMKGTGGGARLQLGNLSAPWLAIAFVAGAFYKRPSRAAAAGVTATLAGLATGLVLGAFGSAWAARRSRRAAGAIALLFVLEPFAWVALGLASGRHSIQHPWWVWLPETVLGVAAILILLRRSPASLEQ